MNLRSILTASALTIAVSATIAQTPNAVPMPSQFATAKTIFVAYAGAPRDVSLVLPAGQLIYIDLQNALTANRRYSVVTRPADAELSARLSIEPGLLVRLAVFDTKTGVLLWTVEESLDLATTKAHALNNHNLTTVSLVNDLESLAASKLPDDLSTPPNKKKRLSDGGK
jgi:hypothetical protein